MEVPQIDGNLLIAAEFHSRVATLLHFLFFSREVERERESEMGRAIRDPMQQPTVDCGLNVVFYFQETQTQFARHLPEALQTACENSYLEDEAN